MYKGVSHLLQVVAMKISNLARSILEVRGWKLGDVGVGPLVITSANRLTTLMRLATGLIQRLRPVNSRHMFK